MIKLINMRFNQETMFMIQSIENVYPLSINSNDIADLFTAFDLNSCMLKTEINLL